MLGISVYLGNNPDQNKQWIQKAGRYKFSVIFTSLHIPEEDASLLKERLILLGKAAEETGMQIMADAGPKSLKQLGIEKNSVSQLKEWNIGGIRADYGFSDDEIVALSQGMKVGLNASTMEEKQIRHWSKNGLVHENVEAWHNFYPRQNTGISSAFLHEKNLFLKGLGLTTAAFVPGDKILRGPVHEGLPTLEKHRKMNPYHGAVELRHLGTDLIVIGDIEASDVSLQRLQALEQGILTLRSDCASEAAISKVHTNRQDAARDVVRSVESRSYAASNGEKVKPIPPQARPVGSITIDNEKYGRYAGELQITKTDLPPDERVNVIGKVNEEDLPLLSYIGPGQKFLLQ